MARIWLLPHFLQRGGNHVYSSDQGAAVVSKTVYEIRRENLARLLSEPGAKTALAIKLGVTQARITHLLKPIGSKGSRPIHEDQARQIESIIGLTPRALDQDPEAPASSSPLQVDSRLLEDSVRSVISAAADAHSKLVADKAAAIVRLVYEHSRTLGRVDPAYVAQLVKLMR